MASTKITARSKLETRVMKSLNDDGLLYEYEPDYLSYTVPERKASYLPDLKLPNGIYVEIKGKLDRDTRRKMLLVKKQNPDTDIRFLMHRNNLLVKGGKRRYSDWARINKFPCCFMEPGKTVEQEPWTTIIKEWYEEDCK